jgi:hypothetical protein
LNYKLRRKNLDEGLAALKQLATFVFQKKFEHQRTNGLFNLGFLRFVEI